MEKDLIFFGEGGITDTTANKIADFAKLSYTDEETALSSMSFINESIETINGETSKAISFGVKDLSDVEDRIQYIGDLKALCAWLREAIAAHQRLLKEMENYSFDDYCQKYHNEDLPERPKRENVLTEDEVIASFDIKKRNRYYYLEAQAATIGQLLHKNCAIDAARKKYYDKLNNPRRISGSGCDTLIYTYSPSVSKDEIENMFYALQQKHAQYQSELNSIKSEIKSRITNDTIEKNKRYDAAYNEYVEKMKVIFNEFNSWKAEESKRIAAFNIILPNSLKDIYERVSSIGKKK